VFWVLDYACGMRFGVLGPLQVVGDSGPVALGGQKERLLLALLLARPNRVVAVEALIEGLWGEHPPRSAAKTLQSYVVRLRHSLEPGRVRGSPGGVLVTRTPGYLLRVAPGALDAAQFEERAAGARRLLAGGDPGAAAALLGEALGLWRGQAFEALADAELTGAEAVRLEELRLGAVEDRVQAELALGRHRELVPELERLTGEQPLRERFWAQLMLALYRAGRQADALLAYGRARAILVEELGIDPGAELRGLHAQILAQDSALDAPTPQAPVVPELPAALDPGGRPLVGREAELGWLRGAWQRTVRGRGGLALVTGAPGMGKTRLAAELAAEVHGGGAVVLYGRCQPDASEHDLMGPLSPALAVWGGLGWSAPTSGDPTAAGATLVEFVAHWAGDRPVLLVVDDLDRADTATLETLVGLAASATAQRLLLLGAADSDAAPELVALAELAERDGAGHRRLGAMHVAEVAQLAGFYASAEEATRAAGRLLADSGGVPAQVHQAASAWARALVAKRVDQAASRTASDRARLRAAQAELTRDLTDIQEVGEQADAALAAERAAAGDRTGLVAVVCPYKGLARYEPGDAAYFFGRERLVAVLVAQLVGAGLLGVVGASGSGKSSAVRAGLLAALRDGVLPGSEQWRQVLIRPGEHPLSVLARAAGAAPDVPGGSPNDALATADRQPDRAIRRLAAGAERLVLVVDQFEEVFTTCRDEAERAAFLGALTEAASADRYVTVVVAVRADYYGRCAAYPQLARLMAANHVLVGPMDHDELRRAIQAPANLAGLRLEAGLPEALLADVAGEPGGLPLLSTALLESWEHRRGRTLTLAAYHQAGGVRGAIARLAERAWQQLDANQQEVARRLLLRLAGPGEGDQVVRRRVPLEEVAADRDQPAGRVLAVLADRRLLTVDEGTVEVAHEALLHEWPRLRGWLADDVQGRTLHRHLASAAREWDQAARDPGELYRGARLAGALDWARDHPADLNEVERAFLDAARAATEREVADVRRRAEQAALRAEQEARYSRRLRVALAGLAGLLAVALAAGSFATVQRGHAQHAALVADARRLGAQALVEKDLDRSLLLAMAANRLDDSPDTRSALLASLQRSPEALRVFRGSGNRLQRVALSGDGETLAAVDEHSLAHLWDVRSGRREILKPPVGATLFAPAFSPVDDDLLATGGFMEGGGVLLWDVAQHKIRRQLQLKDAEGIVYDLAFSPDGHVLAVGTSSGSVSFWNPASGRQLGQAWHAHDPPEGFGVSLAFAHRSATLYSSVWKGKTIRWDAVHRRPLRTFEFGGEVAVSAKDGTLALSQPGGRILLADAATGQHRRFLPGHSGSFVAAPAFDPRNDQIMASVSDDRAAIIWDVTKRQAQQTLRGHLSDVHGVTFSPDGKTLYTCSSDDTVIAWDLTGRRGLARQLTRGAGAVTGVAFSPSDPNLLALVRSNGAPTLWDATKGARIATLELGGEGSGGKASSPVEALNALAFRPDGKLLATLTGDGKVVLWDLAGRRPAGRALQPTYQWNGLDNEGLAGVASSVAFSPKGRLLAAAKDNGGVVLWDLATRRQHWPVPYPNLRGPGAMGALAFSPDGKTLASVGDYGTVVLVSVSDGKVRTLAGLDSIQALAFSRNGILAGGSYYGKVALWDTRSGAPRGRVWPAHSAGVATVTFSPDGKLLATSGGDGSAALWDLADGNRLGMPLVGGRGSALAAFDPTGRTLATAFAIDGAVLLWDVDPASWRTRACALAGRDLTRQEWAELLSGHPYQSVCPQ
jgi:WD40 repeat protein/DNA-binding SARP family transcriptional activator